MPLFEILYTISTLIAIVACIPQMRQLVTAKRSDEFNLSTWVTWLGTQVVSLIYVSSLEQMLLVAASTCWVLFYACMVGMIMYYRRPAHLLRLAEQEVSDL